MSVSYGSIHVDERYSAILEPNLYYNSIFADGVTFTSKYEQGAAGGIFVRKLATSPVTVALPGSDFTDTAASDTLIPIALVNNYQSSKKIYGVQAENVSCELADENLSIATQECAEAWNKSGVACLLEEGTASTITAPADYGALKTAVIAERAKITKAKGSADVLILTPEMYALILGGAGAEYTPIFNEGINSNGAVGKWLGFTVVEAPVLGETALKYYNHASTLKTKSGAKVQFILYHHEAFSIVNNFDAARIVDSENFVGSKAQVELNAGFRVTNADLVRVASIA